MTTKRNLSICWCGGELLIGAATNLAINRDNLQAICVESNAGAEGLRHFPPPYLIFRSWTFYKLTDVGHQRKQTSAISNPVCLNDWSFSLWWQKSPTVSAITATSRWGFGTRPRRIKYCHGQLWQGKKKLWGLQDIYCQC